MTLAKNVILITVDSLRREFLGCYSKEVETPNICSLGDEGILFENAFANSPGTPSSFISMFTSTYPLMYNMYPYLRRPRKPLAEALAEKGYLTVGVSSNPFLTPTYGFNRGFRAYYDVAEYASSSSVLAALARASGALTRKVSGLSGVLSYLAAVLDPPYPPAELVTKVAVSVLSKIASRRFFLWVHYMDAHMPYLLHRPLLSQLRYLKNLADINCGKNGVEELKKLYAYEVRRIDANVGELLKTLERLKLRDDTAVVLTSDHGEEFMEHGDIGHKPKLYDELLRIPLIISHTSLGRGSVGVMVDQLDIAPTVLSILGLPKPRSWLGRSLLDAKPLRDKLVFSEVANPEDSVYPDPRFVKVSCRSRLWKLVASAGGGVELYDLRSDPGERRNVAEERGDVVKRLLRELLRHLRFEERTRMLWLRVSTLRRRTLARGWR